MPAEAGLDTSTCGLARGRKGRTGAGSDLNAEVEKSGLAGERVHRKNVLQRCAISTRWRQRSSSDQSHREPFKEMAEEPKILKSLPPAADTVLLTAR
jgi:hypothetical protein